MGRLKVMRAVTRNIFIFLPGLKIWTLFVLLDIFGSKSKCDITGFGQHSWEQQWLLILRSLTRQLILESYDCCQQGDFRLKRNIPLKQFYTSQYQASSLQSLHWYVCVLDCCATWLDQEEDKST